MYGELFIVNRRAPYVIARSLPLPSRCLHAVNNAGNTGNRAQQQEDNGSSCPLASQEDHIITHSQLRMHQRHLQLRAKQECHNSGHEQQNAHDPKDARKPERLSSGHKNKFNHKTGG